MRHMRWTAGMCLVVTAATYGQDWSLTPVADHSTYQAVQANGSSAYAGGFPVRLRGVLLNNPEDWLSPAFVPSPGVGTFNLGGQWEIFVQAVDLDGTPYDADPLAPFADFGGTAAWMGQNYAGLPFANPTFMYSEAQWTSELNRLNYAGGTPGVDPLIRAGDLIELRVRAGLAHQGKMNVNEQHNTDPAKDFEVVLLQQGFGRPSPAMLTLSYLKAADDAAIFDSTRQAGGEHHQSGWIQINGVQLQSAAGWGPGGNLTLVDGTGRTLPLRLGLNDTFLSALAPVGTFDVVGILNQGDPANVGGYYLVALDASAFIPEPGALAWLAGAALALCSRRRAAR